MLSSVTSSPTADYAVHHKAGTKSTLGAGAIAGIAIGSFVGIIAAVVLVLFLRRKGRTRRLNPYASRAELPAEHTTGTVKYAYHEELEGSGAQSELEAKEAKQGLIELP